MASHGSGARAQTPAELAAPPAKWARRERPGVLPLRAASFDSGLLPGKDHTLASATLLGPSTAPRHGRSLAPFLRRRGAVACLVLLAAVAASPATARTWQPARIEPRIDNLDDLLRGCEERHARARDQERQANEWIAYQAAAGAEAPARSAARALPPCTAEALVARLQSREAGVWAMTPSMTGTDLFATVNLPLSAVLLSRDGGATWHYRHVFARDYNVDRGMLLRGLEYRHGLLAVATEDGLLLSRDHGRTFSRALPRQPLSAVSITGRPPGRILTGGNGTSFLSADGGATWVDLGFSAFTRTLATNNRHLTDHITSVDEDPVDPGTFYVGTGSHVYRLVLDGAGGFRWQAMEGDHLGRVLDDSTVYNVEVASRFMISTCNGVYYLARQGGDRSRDQADVSWRKFRDGAFANRSVGGPKGNLRSYYVAEDPTDPTRILVADFAGLYEGRAVDGQVHWQRVTDLPFYSPATGYPEYTAIAWTSEGGAVVGSRYRGIFVQRPAPGPPPSNVGTSCFLQ